MIDERNNVNEGGTMNNQQRLARASINRDRAARLDKVRAARREIVETLYGGELAYDDAEAITIRNALTPFTAAETFNIVANLRFTPDTLIQSIVERACSPRALRAMLVFFESMDTTVESQYEPPSPRA